MGQGVRSIVAAIFFIGGALFLLLGVIAHGPSLSPHLLFGGFGLLLIAFGIVSVGSIEGAAFIGTLGAGTMIFGWVLLVTGHG